MKHYKLGLPVALYCAGIFLLSSMETLPESASAIPDKVAHVILYSGLGFLAGRYLRRSTDWRTLSVCCVSTLFCLLYGMTDEFHQYFVRGRTAEIGDVLADMLGGLLGAVGYGAFFSKPGPSLSVAGKGSGGLADTGDSWL